MMVAGAAVRSDAPARMGRVRVAYVIDSLGHGGAEHLLAAYLRRLPSLGIDPIVIALQDRDGNPTAADIARLGVAVVDLGIERLRQRGAYREVAAAIKAARPDLVHTQLEFANVLGAAAAARMGLPVVSTLHTLEDPPRWTRAGLRSRLMAWSLRRHADLVIAVSEHARAHHIAHLHLPARLVTTIHNGIETGRFLTGGDREAVRSALGIPPSVPLIVTVAVLRPLKGIDRMLEALPAVLARVPDARYLVVGDGEARNGLARTAAALGIADRVSFAGARADVPLMLSAADLFVLPSLTEALPTVVAEAMAAGLPVVATRVGGIPEMIDASTGILVPPDDVGALAQAVCALLEDPAGAAARGRQGRIIASGRFDLATQAARLTGEYRRLVAARRP
ncbi:MAG: glycosyltransferase [Actinobacteria bacterium]|nr:glycosyltransferase [Actinomycetota bacterium]